MFFKLSRCRLVFNLAVQCITSRTLVTKKTCYYTTLGLSPGASVGEIKSAYYNLSMVYHPDKNDGSEEAAEKFRAITEAYDILSNVNRKKLYDKGLYNPSMSDTWKAKPNIIKKRSTVPQQGKTPYYDFDSWTKAHYGRTFRKEKFEKEIFDNLEKHRKTTKEDFKREVSLMVMLACFVALAILLETIYETNLDDLNKSKKSSEQR